MYAKKSILVLIAVFLPGCFSDEPDKTPSITERMNVAMKAVEQAVATKAKIKSTEERVFESLEKIEKLTGQYDPRDLKTEELLMEQYRERQLPLMREWGVKLIGAKEKFASDWKIHITAVKKAPEVFRQCKNEYLRWASSQDDDEFKALYEDMAELSESWAIAMEKRSVTLAKMHEDFVRKTQFIDDSVIFLGRLEAFLKTIPDAGRATELKEFMEEIDNYIEAFQRTIDSFKEFSDKLKEEDYLEEKELTWGHSLQPQFGVS